MFLEVSAPCNWYLASEASFVCNPHQILASLTLEKLPLSYVVGIAESEALSSVEVSEARSSPNLAVILAFLALLRSLSEVRSRRQ